MLARIPANKSSSDRIKLENEIADALRDFIGLNNNKKRIASVQALIIDVTRNPGFVIRDETNPLSRLKHLFHQALDDIKDPGVTIRFLELLLLRSQRRLLDLPMDVLGLILRSSDIDLVDLSRIPTLLDFHIKKPSVELIRIIERKLQFAISNMHRNESYSEERYATLVNNINLLISGLDNVVSHLQAMVESPDSANKYRYNHGLWNPLYFAASHGMQHLLDDIFNANKSKKLVKQQVPAGKMVSVPGANGVITHYLSTTPKIRSIHEEPSIHYRRVVLLGIMTFQPAKKYLTSLDNHPSIRSFYNTVSHPYYGQIDQMLGSLASFCVTACNVGNVESLIAIMSHFKQHPIDGEIWKFPSQTIHNTLTRGLINPDHLNTQLLYSAYLAKNEMLKSLFLRCHAEPLKMIDKVAFVRDEAIKRIMIIDMLTSLIQKNPDHALAIRLLASLENGSDFTLSINEYVEIYQQHSIFEKLYR